MNAFDLTPKWIDGALTKDDILAYMMKNVWSMDKEAFSPKMSTHVTDCCFEIYQWARGEIAFLEGTLEAFVKNDLKAALSYAGPLLRHGGLWAIHIFLYNVAPRGWEKRKVPDGTP